MSGLTDFKKTILNIKKTDKLAIIYHPDADGFTSAFIASAAIERLCGRKPKLVFCQKRRHVEIVDRSVKKLKDAKINYVITVDLCVDQAPKNIKRIEKFAKLLIIDHHKTYYDLNSDNIVFIKANKISKLDGSKYPASKMTYDLFSKLVNLEDISWVAAVGVMGDNATSTWKSFVKKAAKRAKVKEEDLLEIKKVIDGVEALNGDGFIKLMKEFEKAKKPKDLLKGKSAKYKKLLDNRLCKLMTKAMNDTDMYSDIELMIFDFKEKFNMKSAFVNQMSNIHPNMTIIAIEDLGKEMVGVSARRQDFKIKMNELLEEATKNLDGASGGGHIPASGGKIKRKDREKFKKNIIRILKKKY